MQVYSHRARCYLKLRHYLLALADANKSLNLRSELSRSSDPELQTLLLSESSRQFLECAVRSKLWCAFHLQRSTELLYAVQEAHKVFLIFTDPHFTEKCHALDSSHAYFEAFALVQLGQYREVKEICESTIPALLIFMESYHPLLLTQIQKVPDFISSGPVRKVVHHECLSAHPRRKASVSSFSEEEYSIVLLFHFFFLAGEVSFVTDDSQALEYSFQAVETLRYTLIICNIS